MKIRILSDLHLEFSSWTPPPVEADVVVLAGDIHLGVKGLGWAREQFSDAHIIYVAGNHEFYGGHMQEVLVSLREVAERLGIHVLDADEFILKDTRFLGATLWTDFALYGNGPKLRGAMNDARRRVSDFRMIRNVDGNPFCPEIAREIHRAQVTWLEGKLSETFDGSTVVITHHLPHLQSIKEKYQGNALNPAFASDLAYLVRPPASLWIHGHTHDSVDYVVNGTRVVCNPRGYLPMEPNPAFDPTLVVEASSPDPLSSPS